jgi:hypothetical protein
MPTVTRKVVGVFVRFSCAATVTIAVDPSQLLRLEIVNKCVAQGTLQLELTSHSRNRSLQHKC